MPPRISGVPRLGQLSLCLRPAPGAASALLLAGGSSVSATSNPTTTASTTTHVQTASMSTKEKKRMAKQEPYRWAQMQQRKNAHLERRAELQAQRDAELGHPVRGVTTTFIESLDKAGQATTSSLDKDADGKPIPGRDARPLPTSPHILNHLLTRDQVDSAIEAARVLTEPRAAVTADDAEMTEPERERFAERQALHQAQHERAVEAIRRITTLEAASAPDILRANKQRCVETFGRHVTDGQLRPRPLSRGVEPTEKPVRGGADTGSSEVQIAILTTKIRALADRLEGYRGYRDKAGKRDLRLMVHRRQRLLRYMERKERGSDRWFHMLHTLGLTPATWKGQITL